MTTAPTAAQIDDINNGNVDEGVPGAGLTLIAQAVSTAAQGSSYGEWTVGQIYIGYTQNNSTIGLLPINDPTSDWPSAVTVYGLISQYENVLLREYVFTANSATDVDSSQTLNVVADDTEQARINNPDNWVTAP